MFTTVRDLVQPLRDAVRSQLWPIPVLGVAVAIALGVLLPSLDARVDPHLPGWLGAATFSGDAGAARTVLDAVASSLITVTSLTFSLTVVTLQLASSQFSPRLLRTFTGDRFVQVTLALFLATFVYSLSVLRSVHSSSRSSQPSAPRLAVTSSYLLALASVVALVLFLAHLTRQIRVETMLVAVHQEARKTVATALTSGDGEAGPAVVPPPDAEILWARTSGFLHRIDQDALLRAADEADLLLSIDHHVGTFLVEGTPLGHAWGDAGNRPRAEELRRLRSRVAQAVHLGPERTVIQDLGYGLRQLTDVAIKALSPWVNDPTTAIHALGHSAALLAQLAQLDLAPVRLRDEHGETRVLIARPGFDDLLDLAVDQPRSYGRADSQVLGRLYQLLSDVAWQALPRYRAPIRSQLRRLDRTTADQDFDDEQLARLADLGRRVEYALTTNGEPPSSR